VVVTGPSWSGKSELLRRIAGALAGQDDLDVSVVLAGVRPEEIADWKTAGVEPPAAVTFAASPDAQSQAVERVVETAKRIASRGGNAVVLIDGLAGVHPPTARRVLAAARDIPEGGSLTIIASAPVPLGGENTIITLDAKSSTLESPTLAKSDSRTLRKDLLAS
jgi:transcription termination factor Rho